MLNSNELNKENKEEIIKKVLEKLEKEIIEESKEGKKKLKIDVERNGWFDYCYDDYDKEKKVNWGLIINDVIRELKNNNFIVNLYNSYGTVSYTKILEIKW